MPGFLRMTGLALALGLFLGACNNSTSRTAASYNDRVVGEVQRASVRMANFYALDSKEDVELEALITFLAATRERLERLDPFEDDPSLRDQGLAMMDFYEGLCQQENRRIMELAGGEVYAREDSVEVQRILASILVEEKNRNDSFAQVQRRFADEHGIVLVKE